MAENMGKWPSGHGRLTKIRLSDGCGGKTNTTAAQFEYDRHGFEGYLGNVRSSENGLKGENRMKMDTNVRNLTFNGSRLVHG